MSKFHMFLNGDQFELLKLCKKKKRLTCQDAPWFDLLDMVKAQALDRCVATEGKNAGWSHFKLSRRGKRYLEQRLSQSQKARN